MKHLLLSILALFTISTALAAQSTTYYQNRQYSERSSSTPGYFYLYGAIYTAQNAAELDVSQMVVGRGSCGGQGTPPMGFVVEYSICRPVLVATFGPQISTFTNGRTCSGPSSAHVEWAGSVYDATFTYVWRGQGREPGCYYVMLTGQVTQ